MSAKAEKVSYLERAPIDIARVYELIAGKPLEGENTERAGRCLNPSHKDKNPSCHYNVEKGLFNCKACSESGNAWALVLLSGVVETKADVMKWLVENRVLQDRSPAASWDRVDHTFDYVDEEGALLYQVGRWDNPKEFRQRMPSPKGGWLWNLNALERRVPFMLPELLRAVNRDETIYVVEGEKDVMTLYKQGLMATTNAQGSNWVWPVEWGEYFRNAKQVIVIADNDEAGRKCASHRAGIIARTAQDVRLIQQLPGVTDKGDVSDWLVEPGNTVDVLEAIAAKAPKVEPYIPPYPMEAVLPLVSNLTDTGNGRWLVACKGDEYRHIIDYKQWYWYNGKVWYAPVNTTRLTEQVIDLMRQAAEDYDGPDGSNFAEHVDKAYSMNMRRNMLESAQGPLGEYSREFDKHPHLLNCNNGTLNLHTGELQPHDCVDYLTLLTPIDYDPSAKCPTFCAWLMEACGQSEGLFNYMQQVMGSCLEGRVGVRRFYFIVGPKGTGKSTFIRTLEAMLGPYQCSTDFKALSEQRFTDSGNGPSPAFARLKGKRLVTASEASEAHKLDTAKIKQLIGGDSITARNLNQNMDEFKFEATLIMSGNEMPRIIGDESVWDKLKPVPFMHAIDGEDPDYEAKNIHPELAGILNFALDGLKRLRENGYRLQDTPEITHAREEEMTEQDPFYDWAVESLDFSDTKAEMDCGVVYDAYVAWSTKKKQYLHKRNRLTRWLNTKHGVKTRHSNANTFYIGVKLRYVPQNEAEDPTPF